MLTLQVLYGGTYYNMYGPGDEAFKEYIEKTFVLDRNVPVKFLLDREEVEGLGEWMNKNRFGHAFIKVVYEPDVEEAPYDEDLSICAMADNGYVFPEEASNETFSG